MNWDSFFAEPNLLRAKEGELLLEMTDDDVKNLKVEQAKSDLRWDVEEVLGVNISDPIAIAFLQSNEVFLKEMLALRQLYWFFLERDAGEGSIQHIKATTYKRLYDERKARLGSLIVQNTPSLTTITIVR